jgi:hypothetical protein
MDIDELKLTMNEWFKILIKDEAHLYARRD